MPIGPHRVVVWHHFGVVESQRPFWIFHITIQAIGDHRIDAVTRIAALISPQALRKVVRNSLLDVRVAVHTARRAQMQIHVRQIGVRRDHAWLGGIRKRSFRRVLVATHARFVVVLENGLRQLYVGCGLEVMRVMAMLAREPLIAFFIFFYISGGRTLRRGSAALLFLMLVLREMHGLLVFLANAIEFVGLVILCAFVLPWMAVHAGLRLLFDVRVLLKAFRVAIKAFGLRVISTTKITHSDGDTRDLAGLGILHKAIRAGVTG